MWSVVEPASIVTLEVMENKQRGYRALLVSLANCEVRVYREKFLADTLKTPAVVNAMRFGRFGREDSTLVMVTKGG
jgi:Bardet-Biedl syndrome 1 protein